MAVEEVMGRWVIVLEEVKEEEEEVGRVLLGEEGEVEE